METKKAKILSVQENQKSYNSKNGMAYVHFIKFEGDTDNRNWEYHSKKPTCDKFKSGQEASFEFGPVVNGNYTNYKIKPIQENGSQGYSGDNSKDQGIITYLSCLSSAANYHAQKGPNNWDDVMQAADQAFQKAFQKSTLK